ncbi:hypothetical protein [Globicatella sanguinis]
MKLQANLLKLLEEKEPNHVDLLIDYIKDIEDNRVPNRNANERLLDEIEKIILEEGNIHDN